MGRNEGGNKIDIVAANDLENRLDFYEVKHNKSRIKIPLPAEKAAGIRRRRPGCKTSFRQTITCGNGCGPLSHLMTCGFERILPPPETFKSPARSTGTFKRVTFKRWHSPNGVVYSPRFSVVPKSVHGPESP
jgi:hypothetical protein